MPERARSQTRVFAQVATNVSSVLYRKLSCSVRVPPSSAARGDGCRLRHATD